MTAPNPLEPRRRADYVAEPVERRYPFGQRADDPRRPEYLVEETARAIASNLLHLIRDDASVREVRQAFEAAAIAALARHSDGSGGGE